MPIDPHIHREAEEILRLYSRSAQDAIKQNLYGPREARLAGAIVANALVVVTQGDAPAPADQLRDLQYAADEHVHALCTLLEHACGIIEQHVAGHEDFVTTCEAAISDAQQMIEDLGPTETAEVARDR